MLSFTSQVSSYPYDEMFAWDFTFIGMAREKKFAIRDNLICEKGFNWKCKVCNMINIISQLFLCRATSDRTIEEAS